MEGIVSICKDDIKVITLIGSMQFYEIMLDTAVKEHELGNIVIVPFRDHRYKHAISENTKHMYDVMIRKSIDMCDEVLVINADGYIGPSTKSEIAYAISVNKKIRYLNDTEHPTIRVALIGSYRFWDKFNEESVKLFKQGMIPIKPISYGLINEDTTEDQILSLHEIQHNIIEMADIVYVVNYNGYIGNDTEAEIDYAMSIFKPIMWMC
jgi:hypothetical protein